MQKMPQCKKLADVSTNHVTGFYMKRNTGLRGVKTGT